ncbi:MAG: polyphenol oxidase family protein [Candidatus Omnitrophota bacterium]
MAEVDYTQFLGVTSFTSEAPLDFMKGDPGVLSYALTPAQQLYLNDRGIPARHGVVVPKQVHGDVIWEVARTDVAQAGVVEADAVVTDVPGLPIAIRTADCLPALMYVPGRGVVAAVHAGWKSTRLMIVQKTVDFLRQDFGVDPADIRVAIGPCIRCASCEVGAEFKDFFPLDTVETEAGLRLDIVQANLRQLVSAGVSRGNIFDCGFDSYANKARFHSFRRDADASGRMLSVIMM